MGRYIDGSGLSHFMGILKGAFASKSVAISNITRSGTTFTATRADGTSFTFTQQDNTASKTSTTPKMNGTAAVGSESAYAAGDHVHPSDTSRVPTTRTVNGHALSSNVTITASDIGVSSGAEVNQNAFSNVSIYGSNTVLSADSKTDTLELRAGDGIYFVATDEGNKLTIGSSYYYDIFDGAYDGNDGGSGLVPAPVAEEEFKVLAGDGIWWDIGDLIANASENYSPYGFVVVEGMSGSTGLGPGDTHTAIRELNSSDITGALGNTPVARATGDASGNDIASTYASKLSPALAGTPTAPTAAAGTNTTQIATTAFVANAVSTYAPKASPALTGTPTAPTAAAGTNTTQIATTAFVTNAVSSFASGALQYKGTVTAESVITSSAYKKGWYWIVNMPDSTTTSITVAGKSCEAGDMIIAKQDKTSTLANDIDIIQSNIEVLSNGEIDSLWAAA